MNCILSVFTSHINCIGKNSKLNAHGAWKIAIISNSIHIAREHRQIAIQYLYSSSFYNKVCCDIAYFNKKMSYLSDFKRTKSKTLRTASKQTNEELHKAAVWSSANNTNKRFIFLKFDYLKYSNILLLYNLHVIYFWNGPRERRSSHWNLQLHTRLAER